MCVSKAKERSSLLCEDIAVQARLVRHSLELPGPLWLPHSLTATSKEEAQLDASGLTTDNRSFNLHSNMQGTHTNSFSSYRLRLRDLACTYFLDHLRTIAFCLPK